MMDGMIGLGTVRLRYCAEACVILRAMLRSLWSVVVGFFILGCQVDPSTHPVFPPPLVEQRTETTHLRGQRHTTLFSYNIDFFQRHRPAYLVSSGIHFAHGKQHDVLLLNPFDRHAQTDYDFNLECLAYLYHPPPVEPQMQLYGPYTSQAAWQLYRAIDWTHLHHEQTYDILSDKNISWSDKKGWTDRAVDYYLHYMNIPRSPAPLDVTMRRARVMMKPYFTRFRNYYPLSNNFFYYAHWWHPAIYEALLLAGNDEEQESMIRQTNQTGYLRVLVDRPLRMLLSREVMPRYSRFSPESANIFDNLHMLHGIAYDILAYDKWTIEQKRAELYRVIDAMKYHPGDERLARKFPVPYPDMDPRVYYDWMRGTDGEMNRIMREMLEEMMPMMMPPGMTEDQHERLMSQFKMKMTPGLEDGEQPGSLMEALKALMPDMQMMPEAMEPGGTPQKMIEAMLQGWDKKYGSLPNVLPLPMEGEPTAPPPPAQSVPISVR